MATPTGDAERKAHERQHYEGKFECSVYNLLFIVPGISMVHVRNHCLVDNAEGSHKSASGLNPLKCCDDRCAHALFRQSRSHVRQMVAHEL